MSNWTVKSSELRIRSSQQAARNLTSDYRSIEARIQALARPLNTRDWPSVGPPRPELSSGLAPVPGIDATEVRRRWNSGGEAWLKGASRKELRACVQSVREREAGSTLRSDVSFVNILLARLTRSRWKAAVIEARLFSTFPADAFSVDLVKQNWAVLASRKWVQELGWGDPQIHKLPRLFGDAVNAGLLIARGDLGLGGTLWNGPWVEAIVLSRKPASLDHVRNQLQFARGSRGELQQVEMDGATAAVLKHSVELVKHRLPQGKRTVAELARKRVGSPFGLLAVPRWGAAASVLPDIRAWLAGEVLKILFSRLVPNSDAAHQTKPREKFWAGYTGYVSRIWIAVPRKLQGRLDNDEVRRIQTMLGDDLQILRLDGQPNQALVWMQLVHRGATVTIVEGNANTRVRIRVGGHTPKSNVVHYRNDVTWGAFSGNLCDFETTHDSPGNWRWRVKSFLAQLGIQRESR